MGSGASNNLRNTLSHLLNDKPEDASDITDFETAKKEIIQLRKWARAVLKGNKSQKCQIIFC
jgi:hypothetical protein